MFSFKQVQIEWSKIVLFTCFTSAMILQIFWPSFYGNEIFVNSSLTINAFYETNWFELDIKGRRKIILVMEMVKKPVLLVTAFIFEIRLESFLFIIKCAYTLVSVFEAFEKFE